LQVLQRLTASTRDVELPKYERLPVVGAEAYAFHAPYFTKTPVGLRRVQGVAAGLWALYGVMIHSLPVIAANILVASVAVVSSFRKPAALASPP